MINDDLTAIADTKHYITPRRPHLFQQVGEKRLTGNGDHWLRDGSGDRGQSGSQATG
jgi:hypothetical protein